MNTAESKLASPVSATPSFIVFVWFGTTLAVQVSTVVKPSIWMLILGLGLTLSRKYSALTGVADPLPTSLPSLIVLTETGVAVPGTSAQFVPLTKRPNTSSNSVFE
jgi:hypothetical protein